MTRLEMGPNDMREARTERRRSGGGRRPLRALWHDRRGASMLEFALIATPFFGLMFAILGASLVFFAQQGLETAAETAARVITTGEAQATAMTSAQFKTKACAKLPTYLKCARLMIDVQKASSFGAIDTGAPTLTFDASGNITNGFAFTPGNGGDIVIVRLMYIWDLPVGTLGLDLSNLSRGKRLLIATTVAKTEPY